MSFSSETKNELARLEPDKKCCMLAEIAGFLRISGSIKLLGGGKQEILINTENLAVARHFKKMIKMYFDSEVKVESVDSQVLRKNKIHTLQIGYEQKSEEILRETGVLMIKEGMNAISDGVPEQIIKTKCCKKSYLRGLFLGAGNITDPEKSYHFEIVANTEVLAKDIVKLLNSFSEINAKYIKRKKQNVVYVKDSEQIVDILNILNAHSQLLKIENIRVQKSVLNQVNRKLNCDSANMDKTIKASEKQIKAIEKIEKNIGLENLPEKLESVAVLRMQYPEASLQELAELMKPPMKKSGINNRLKKIMDISKEF